MRCPAPVAHRQGLDRPRLETRYPGVPDDQQGDALPTETLELPARQSGPPDITLSKSNPVPVQELTHLPAMGAPGRGID